MLVKKHHLRWLKVPFFTEQLVPDKEAILQIERNEFVPQSFNSSAATKGTQVISTYLLIL